ncbi:MAG: Na/Pi cotransporter family protein [Peptostreptococcaceae bacterium]|jgi:phosphate:Na+ symporter|nr:Na/Pi cotransporter family protein [Peptostreptococcaceae bacterium]
MALEITFGVLGGLGLFLYGMNLMGSGLQKSAGSKLKQIIELLTSNKYMGVLVGTFVTAIIQSSSATTVMVVGFVNAGIMQLSQAIGVIMGANVGTTITAQLVSFKLTDFAPVAVGIGMIIYLFTSKEKNKQMAEILIGFGILFIGMDFLKDAVHPLREIDAFKDMLASFSHNPILGILMGFGLTVTVQSSSASMGILLALASTGMITIEAALPILYGENIGTCTTALLSSIGATKNAKRAATMHLIFNIIGTLMFALVLNIPIRHIVLQLNPDDVARQIANAHTLFNVLNVIIQIPLSGFIVKLALKLIPETKDELLTEHKNTKYLDERILETPSIAIVSVIKECLHMGKETRISLKMSLDSFINLDKKDIKEVFKREKQINLMEKEIVDYLVKLSKREISASNRELIDGLFSTVNDIERVADHAENIAELANVFIERKLSMSEDAKQDLIDMIDRVIKAYSSSLKAMRSGNKDLAFKVISMEEQIDHMEKSCRMNHIYRLNQNQCSTESGILYLDLLSNLERIGDHASNIARAVIDVQNMQSL